MKNFITALAFFALPLAARAQAIINMPKMQESHEIVYTRIQPIELNTYSESAYLFRAGDADDESGILYCTADHPRLRAVVSVEGDEVTGVFDFESKENCAKILNAMSANPGHRVRFRLELTEGAYPYPSNMSWRGGKVTQVEWLDDAK